MKKNLFLAFCLPLLVACQQNDLKEISNESARVNLKAEIMGASRGAISRTTTTDEGKVKFTEGDKIGFYMPDAQSAGEWSYNGSTWNSSVAYEWPDKVKSYHFCAFYPSVMSAPRTAIPMPDLSQQKGTWENLNKYDFIVAHTTSNYTDQNGTVLFTEESAFKHVYTMISVTLKKDKENEEVTLSDICFKAPGLLTPHTYKLGESASDDSMNSSAEAVDEFRLQDLNATVPAEGYNKVIIVNPVTLDKPVDLTITYIRDGIPYTASTTALGTELQQGSFYNLTLRLKKEGLVVEGNSVEDWNVVNMEDINVEETPIE